MYKIYADGEAVGETEDKHFTVTDLKPGTTYEIKVTNSSGSQTVEVTTEQEEIEVLTETYDDLTVAEIKELLDDEGIEYTNNMRKAELIELLQEVL